MEQSIYCSEQDKSAENPLFNRTSMFLSSLHVLLKRNHLFIRNRKRWRDNICLNFLTCHLKECIPCPWTFNGHNMVRASSIWLLALYTWSGKPIPFPPYWFILPHYGYGNTGLYPVFHYQCHMRTPVCRSVAILLSWRTAHSQRTLVGASTIVPGVWSLLGKVHLFAYYMVCGMTGMLLF